MRLKLLSPALAWAGTELGKINYYFMYVEKEFLKDASPVSLILFCKFVGWSQFFISSCSIISGICRKFLKGCHTGSVVRFESFMALKS